MFMLFSSFFNCCFVSEFDFQVGVLSLFIVVLILVLKCIVVLTYV